MSELNEAAARLKRAIADAAEGLVDREALVELVVLAAIAQEHVLIVGPPGTAKSAAVRRAAQRLGGRYFEYLLGRFTEPNEIFGPIDLLKLREGRVETETAGMLPEADVAFLDEVFLGSTAILNTLLSILNERRFRRGHTIAECPIRVCVGASNALPQEESLAAFADRFLVNVFVEGTGDSRLEELLEAGWIASNAPPPVGHELDALDIVRDAALAAPLDEARPWLAKAVRTLRSAGITLSDRRVVKVQRLVAAAAALDGRAAASAADIWPIIYAVPSQNGQALARDTLRELLAKSRNAATPHAAEAASMGMHARAERLLAAGRRLLDHPTEDPKHHALQLEGIAREIDATFPRDAMPEAIADLRAVLARRLGGQGDDDVRH